MNSVRGGMGLHAQQTPQGKMDVDTEHVRMGEAPVGELREEFQCGECSQSVAFKGQPLPWKIPGKLEAQTHLYNIIFQTPCLHELQAQRAMRTHLWLRKRSSGSVVPRLKTWDQESGVRLVSLGYFRDT